jgi:hypothetical protein
MEVQTKPRWSWSQNSRRRSKRGRQLKRCWREKIMGFGHAVYRSSDPRNAIIKEYARKLAASAKLGDGYLYAVSEGVEKVLSVKQSGMPRIDRRFFFPSATEPALPGSGNRAGHSARLLAWPSLDAHPGYLDAVGCVAFSRNGSFIVNVHIIVPVTHPDCTCPEVG